VVHRIRFSVGGGGGGILYQFLLKNKLAAKITYWSNNGRSNAYKLRVQEYNSINNDVFL
jgi:hypothetical protein